MRGSQLSDVFRDLRLPPRSSGEQYAATGIYGGDTFKIAKSESGKPAILISALDTNLPDRPFSLELESVIVRHDTSCLVHKPDGETSRDYFSVVSYHGEKEELQRFFLHLADLIFQETGGKPLRSQVNSAIQRMAKVLSALSRPAQKTSRGLWAELLLIAESQDAKLAVQSWHSDPGERFDFSLGLERLEVKSTSMRTRKHHFTMEQLSPPQGTQAVVASLFVESSGSGESIRDLIERIKEEIHPDVGLLLKLEQIVAETLGSTWKKAMDDKFDLHLAKQSLRCYDSATIPCIDRSLPAEISDVKFVVDISSIGHLSSGFSANRGRLISSILQWN